MLRLERERGYFFRRVIEALKERERKIERKIERKREKEEREGI
jgi:hypothetical protein